MLAVHRKLGEWLYVLCTAECTYPSQLRIEDLKVTAVTFTVNSTLSMGGLELTARTNYFPAVIDNCLTEVEGAKRALAVTHYNVNTVSSSRFAQSLELLAF
ncbi:hypothetical protein D3C79_701640 [compost metagenome]